MAEQEPDDRETDAEFRAWENERLEFYQDMIDNPGPGPNVIIERRAELRDSGMDDDQIDRVIQREYPDRDYLPLEAPPLSEWYRQTQAEHQLDLAAPQRFPLTGDGLVTERIIADGPFNGPDIGAELAMARYRDHQYAEKIMPQREIDDKMQAWLQALLAKDQQPKQQASLPLAETRNQTLEQAKEEQTRNRSLSI